MIRPLIAFVVCLAAVAPRVARAQDDTTPLARQAFDEGVQLLDAHRYAEAATAFERSLALNDSPTARYDLALAYRGTDMVHRSIETLRLFLADSSGTTPQMVADAVQVLAEQERKLVHVTLRIDGAAPASIIVDDLAAPLNPAQELELDPGHHVFSAGGHDAEPVRVERDFAAGARETIAIDLGTTGHLEVRASPGIADIALDGTSRGHGAFAADLDIGTHHLRVSAAGYLPTDRVVTLHARDRLGLDVSLATPPSAGSDNTWLWVALGVSAVAIGTLIAVVAVLASGTTYTSLDGGSTGVVAMALR